MGKYLLLYTGGGGMAATEAERAAIMQAWTNWFTQLGSNIVDMGNPTTEQGKTVASNGSVRNVPANAVTTGYSIINADSFDAAVKAAQSCPVLQAGGEVTVYETFAVM